MISSVDHCKMAGFIFSLALRGQLLFVISNLRGTPVFQFIVLESHHGMFDLMEGTYCKEKVVIREVKSNLQNREILTMVMICSLM